MTNLLLAIAMSTSIPLGSSEMKLDIRATELEIFCYKPKNYTGERMIMVFHGTLRNASDYRDHAIAMADRFGALIVAPKFDSERFPGRRYNRGGILKEDGTANPKEEWTYAFIPEIAKAVREREAKPKLPYTLIGHSAGGQFLVRLAGFYDSGAVRIVASNAGSALFPTREAPFGYGYGNVPAELSSDEMIKNYLAQPLTLYLGTEDNKPDEYFDESEEAMKQGGGRYQRNQAVYAKAKALATDKGWKFNWRIVEAPGVGHDHEKMFNHERAEEALFGR